MTPETILSNGLAIAIVAALGYAIWHTGKFLTTEVWPYWTDRDAEERARRHEREQAQIETDGLMANALTCLAEAVRGCPFNAVDDTSILVDRLAE